MKYPKIVLALAIIVALPLAVRAAGVGDYKGKEPLPANYIITLQVAEGSVTQEYSHVLAGREFEVIFVEAGTNAIPAPHICLRGTLDPKDAKQVALTYELQIDDQYTDSDQSKKFIRSGCTGQLLLQDGVPVAVLTGGKRAFRLTVERKDGTQPEPAR